MELDWGSFPADERAAWEGCVTATPQTQAWIDALNQEREARALARVAREQAAACEQVAGIISDRARAAQERRARDDAATGEALTVLWNDYRWSAWVIGMLASINPAVVGASLRGECALSRAEGKRIRALRQRVRSPEEAAAVARVAATLRPCLIPPVARKRRRC